MSAWEEMVTTILQRLLPPHVLQYVSQENISKANAEYNKRMQQLDKTEAAAEYMLIRLGEVLEKLEDVYSCVYTPSMSERILTGAGIIVDTLEQPTIHEGLIQNDDGSYSFDPGGSPRVSIDGGGSGPNSN
jgi:hypothetical protein